ncbi:MAG: hypothetical protein LLF76_12510 [Planctomycetaceae bacterium]|nr:hypothetical protein [Planctomycetaceae bacterium]
MRKLIVTATVIAAMTGVVYGADGFAEKTLGGQGGKTVSIAADAAAFKRAVEAAETSIVQVSGTVDLSGVGGTVDIASNKTIQGTGDKPTIIGELGFARGASNIIIEGLNITNPNGLGEGDGLNVKEQVTNLFVGKCSIYDCSDGCFDITRASDNITVSWCKFYFSQAKPQNNRVSLIGGSDDATADEGEFHVTMHHNWFGPNCWQRIPSVRFGRVHLYNNLWDCAGNSYCIWSRIKAECLVENNVFKGVKAPYRVQADTAAPKGKLCLRGNVFDNCTGNTVETQDEVFKPAYEYKLDDAAGVAAAVQAQAGAK